MGKRQLGELSPAELVITILISNIATLTMEEPDVPLIMGMIPILTLVCLDVTVSYITLRSRTARRVVSGQPRVIISQGVIDQKAMKDLRYTVDDVCATLRTQGIFDLSQVQYAIVETTGSISVLQKAPNRPLTPSSLEKPEPSCDPPVCLISDGDLIANDEDAKDIKKVLKKKHLEIKDVFICTRDANGELDIIKKSKAK
ncbi:MAG: DUF421 domain-containing protein [Oscillospiraceae bacterium]|nr:DUF421 domain-containing protein [Oscillospiraceae bacterium]